MSTGAVLLASIMLVAVQNRHEIRAVAAPTAADSSETVLVVYQVKTGNEAAARKALLTTWRMYTRKKMVLTSGHFLARADDNGKPVYVEVLRWRNASVPGKADAEVRAMWQRLDSLCETRAGQPGIKFTILNPITP